MPVGLEREAAVQAFSEFLTGTTTTPKHIEFDQLIIEEPTQNGVMEHHRLFHSPYNDLNANGLLGVFPTAHVTRSAELLNGIRQTAAA